MNPYLIIGLGVAWLASAGGAFWFGTSYEEGQHAKREVLLADATKEFVAAQQKLTDTLGLQIATEFAGITIKNTTINREVRHEREIQTRVLDNPDCNLPASTARLLNAARSGRADGSSTGAAESRMPADGSPAGTDQPR